MARLNQHPFVLILFALSFLSLTACQAVIHEKGTILDPRKVALIQVGQTTRAQVKEMLGVPTFGDNFRRDRWSYIQDRQLKNLQRTFSRAINRVEVTFDKRGVVQKIQHNFGEALMDPITLPEAQNNQSWFRWLWGGEYMRPAIKSQQTENASQVSEATASEANAPSEAPETESLEKSPEESGDKKPWWRLWSFDSRMTKE